jgi:hypothetical protein
MPVNVREGAVIVNVRGEGCGCAVIFTATFPVAVRSDAGTAAASCVEETKLVSMGVPFQVTLVPLDGKFVPLTVNVNPGDPAGAVFGERLVNVGALDITVNCSAFDTCVPFCTVMDAAPVWAIRLAGTTAVRRLGEAIVVVRGIEFQ